MIPIKGGMTIPNIATFDHGTCEGSGWLKGPQDTNWGNGFRTIMQQVKAGLYVHLCALVPWLSPILREQWYTSFIDWRFPRYGLQGFQTSSHKVLLLDIFGRQGCSWISCLTDFSLSVVHMFGIDKTWKKRTLPETNIFAPENGWLEDYGFFWGPAHFQGTFAVSFREGMFLEPQTTSLKWMFDETIISYIKIWFIVQLNQPFINAWPWGSRFLCNYTKKKSHVPINQWIFQVPVKGGR